jgi:hypothetical protein
MAEHDLPDAGHAANRHVGIAHGPDLREVAIPRPKVEAAVWAE